MVLIPRGAVDQAPCLGVGTIIVRLAVTLGDVWFTLVKTWNISEKLIDTPYFFAGIVI